MISWHGWLTRLMLVSSFYNVALSALALILSLDFFYLAVLNHLAVFCFQTTSKKRGPSINSSVKRSSNNQPFLPSFSLANIFGKDKEWNKNRKQKEIREKSFKNERDKTPFLLSPKGLKFLERVVNKQIQSNCDLVIGLAFKSWTELFSWK